MRDYDAHLEAAYGPDLDGEADEEDIEMDDDAMFYCGDSWCDGHALPNQTCDEPDEEDDHFPKPGDIIGRRAEDGSMVISEYTGEEP